MPFNGQGVFKRLYSWALDAAQNINVLPDRMDADTNDIAAGLSNCLTRDGQGAPSANISWGNFQLNNLADPTLVTDAANKRYVDAMTTAPTSDRSMNGFRLTSVGAPSGGGDAANKAYVDAVIPSTLTTQSTQLAALAFLTY